MMLYIVLSFVKISQRVSKFFSRHDFQTEIFKGEKIHKMELWFLFSAHRLMVLYISTKFHKNISKGFKVIERTRFPRGIIQ